MTARPTPSPAAPVEPVAPTARRRVLVLGATGTIGRATVHALRRRAHEVTCIVRPAGGQRVDPAVARAAPATPPDVRATLVRSGAELREADVLDPRSLARDAFRGERFDAMVSCLASRTGVARDAWAIDHRAHEHALAAARDAGVAQVVLLSAICVQKPRLAFQHAKLAFERTLRGSGLAWSIVRPTAYFKSLSGQVARVRSGAPFVAFGDGRLTACKPIDDDDLGGYLADCLDDPARTNRVLPIGGPGPAITPLDQAAMLSALLGREVRVRHVPVALIDAVAGTLGALARVVPALDTKAELARIGRYYATESMLLWDETAGRYDADATPSTGTATLRDHYARLLAGTAANERGAHAVF
jgi:divinyl chlorophyllide a 8-vinyl-reductase